MPWYVAVFLHYPVVALPAHQYRALQSRTAWPVHSKRARVHISLAINMKHMLFLLASHTLLKVYHMVA